MNIDDLIPVWLSHDLSDEHKRWLESFVGKRARNWFAIYREAGGRRGLQHGVGFLEKDQAALFKLTFG